MPSSRAKNPPQSPMPHGPLKLPGVSLPSNYIEPNFSSENALQDICSINVYLAKNEKPTGDENSVWLNERIFICPKEKGKCEELWKIKLIKIGHGTNNPLQISNNISVLF